MEEMKIGNKSENRTVKQKGVVCESCFTQDSTDKKGMHHGCRGLADVGFSSGRTIELKRFEFCRIKVGMNCSVPNDVGKGDIMEALEEFVLGFVKKEEAALVGNSEPWSPRVEIVDLLNECPCRKIMIAYGLTLKSGKNEYESEQVDISEDIPLSDGVDIKESFLKLSDEIAGYIHTHHQRIKGVDSNNGL